MSNEKKKLSGIEAVALERQRQIEQKGFTTEHDMLHMDDQLVYGAICYAYPPKNRRLVKLREEDSGGLPVVHLKDGPDGEADYIVLPPSIWPFKREAFRPDTSGTVRGRMRDIEKAAAMLVAEYDRLAATLDDAEGA